jgi:hypothetical protein
MTRIFFSTDYFDSLDRFAKEAAAEVATCPVFEEGCSQGQTTPSRPLIINSYEGPIRLADRLKATETMRKHANVAGAGYEV